MLISDSRVAMQSSRIFQSSGKANFIGSWNVPDQTRVGSDSFFRAVGDALEDGTEEGKEQVSNEDQTASEIQNGNGMSIQDQLKLQLDTIQYLLRIILGRNSSDVARKFGELGEGYSAEYSGSGWGGFSTSLEYSEMESMSFSTSGKVQTADGRMIDFDIELSMSRSFYQKVERNVGRFQDPLLDPLVVQLSGNPVCVSNQKFHFDLDGDGTEEDVSNLMTGSAFLALDKNEDGTINDGNELFGTKSGNGFADLMEYDSDGNGWIDEADEIFKKLKVFSVSADGTKNMVSLKEAGIGAINLGSTAGDFSVKDSENRTRGIIRRSGFFLYEDGRPGMMHQIDLATSVRRPA